MQRITSSNDSAWEIKFNYSSSGDNHHVFLGESVQHESPGDVSSGLEKQTLRTIAREKGRMIISAPPAPSSTQAVHGPRMAVMEPAASKRPRTTTVPPPNPPNRPPSKRAAALPRVRTAAQRKQDLLKALAGSASRKPPSTPLPQSTPPEAPTPPVAPPSPPLAGMAEDRQQPIETGDAPTLANSHQDQAKADRGSQEEEAAVSPPPSLEVTPPHPAGPASGAIPTPSFLQLDDATARALEAFSALCADVCSGVSTAHVGVVSHSARSAIDALHVLQTPPLHRMVDAATAHTFQVRIKHIAPMEAQLRSGIATLGQRADRAKSAVTRLVAQLAEVLPLLPPACTPTVSAYLSQPSWAATASAQVQQWVAHIPAAAASRVRFQQQVHLPNFAAATQFLNSCGAFLMWADEQLRWGNTVAGQLHLHTCALQAALQESFLVFKPNKAPNSTDGEQ